MILGFTSTRDGLTIPQLESLRAIVRALAPALVLHGGAEGGDAEIDRIAADLGIRVQVLPAIGAKTRYYCRPGVIVDPPLPPLVRNRLIVSRSTQMLACPVTASERLRSGTWMTIRCAQAMRRPLTIIDPDGVRRDRV